MAASSSSLTPKLAQANLDFDQPDGEGNSEPGTSGSSSAGREQSTGRKAGTAASILRSISWGRKSKSEPPLPKNWKRVREDGQVFYVNSVTMQRSLEVPPFLPPGWREVLDKESGRVYYYHKATRQTTFDLPSGSSSTPQAADDDDDDEEEEAPRPDGVLSRTVNKLKGRALNSEGDASPAASGLQRPSSLTRKSRASKPPKEKERDKERAPPTRQGSQQTVFISCSALLREVKLCVGEEHQEALEELLARLTARQIPAERAVRELMDRVGSTIVQQAGLSVMNLQKGLLPHGWLEYMDDATGRPYYYNVHAKITTWDKPTAPLTPAPSGSEAEPEIDEPDGINIECNVETHNVAMSGFI